MLFSLQIRAGCYVDAVLDHCPVLSVHHTVGSSILDLSSLSSTSRGGGGGVLGDLLCATTGTSVGAVGYGGTTMPFVGHDVAHALLKTSSAYLKYLDSRSLHVTRHDPNQATLPPCCQSTRLWSGFLLRGETAFSPGAGREDVAKQGFRSSLHLYTTGWEVGTCIRNPPGRK
jgi:hypothetical protein